jgi:hypothetical protein
MKLEPLLQDKEKSHYDRIHKRIDLMKEFAECIKKRQNGHDGYSSI